MIRVDRSAVPPPRILDLTDPGAAGSKETRRAIAFHQVQRASETDKGQKEQDKRGPKERRPKKKKGFPYSVYKDASVKDAMERLFYDKCAYCESRYAATQPMDVEHWRPKNEVDVEKDGEIVGQKRGYYWLAANWENLLPSCIDCNRKREQIIQPEGKKRVVGKETLFPLADESKRANKPGAEVSEEPLLLHPCGDDPEEHLEFTEEGCGVVRPKLDSSGQPSLRAKKSIEVCALNRLGLVQDRAEVLKLMQQRMYAIRQLTYILDGNADPAGQELVEDLLFHEMDELQRMKAQERPFSLMAKLVIERFIVSLTG